MAIDHVEVVRNGEVVANVPVSKEGTAASGVVTLDVTESGWYVLRAWSPTPRYPILDVYPFSSTSPVYVTVAGKPVRSSKDAEYFLGWIDKVAAASREHADWNSPAERDAGLARIAEARAIFAQRAKGE